MLIENTPLCDISQQEVLYRFGLLENKKFHLFKYNCEHFISDMKKEPVESKTVDQLSKYLLLFLTVFLVGGLIRKV